MRVGVRASVGENVRVEGSLGSEEALIEGVSGWSVCM